MSERCTEADGWTAQWCLDHLRIRILLVSNSSDAEPLFSAAVDAAAPDLAEMRERFPRLSDLWDAIRSEFWAQLSPGHQHSHGMI